MTSIKPGFSHKEYTHPETIENNFFFYLRSQAERDAVSKDVKSTAWLKRCHHIL